jgi:transcriptional regulator with XRE-family HTH domain
MAETSRSALLRELGAEIASARSAANLGVRELARSAGLSTHSRLSELERGKRLLAMDELEHILDVLAVTASERERLMSLARSADGPGQLNVGVPGVNATLAQLIDHERAAIRITDAAPLLIPGLLQTSDYARAIMAAEPDSELRVTLRSGRRDILTRERQPVELLALIDSEALVRPVASPHVMLDQLRHILRLASLRNVTVQVVSSTATGYHPMLAGPFELLEFAKAAPVVLLDHHSSSAFLWEPEDVARFIEAADLVRTKAMTPARSAEVIAKIVNGLEST